MMPIEDTVDGRGSPLNAPRPQLFTRERYVIVLTWCFTLFASLRMVSYLPTLWTIWEQQDSSQHSILTWLTWLGANLTMAAWLHEHNGRAFNRAVFVNLVNAAMCAATLVLIVMLRG